MAHSNQGASSALTQFDFSAIDEMDPVLADGQTIICDREVPFELRHGGEQDVGSLEAVRVKVMTLGDGAGLVTVTAELTSENDLFFHYTHAMDARAFRSVQEGQKLMVDFAEYPAVLVRMLNACIKEPHTHLAVLVLGRDGRAHLDFIQNLEYKFVELLSVEVSQSDDPVVRQSVAFRYQALKARVALMHARLQDVNALIKLKSPALLAQMQRYEREHSPTRYSPPRTW
ncbi:hypothetical protein KFE25_001848 [Diacronema lutheri]|uniref:Spindle assembly abnormal protein 6 N-terminal domain-containing protein n=1 Tax=Diacronema lutheri TaxID=2081491 RepID=A0A8J5XPH8_DIALT|nr:hypothetical protein KFE25_001848 [Diacronema lutheri]